MTALAVDETGIAAALGSSGRVRKNTWGLLWSREMGGVVLVERWKGWQSIWEFGRAKKLEGWFLKIFLHSD